MTVDDDRRGEPIIGERPTDDAGFAMVERPHGVEQVGDRTHADVDRIAELLIRGR